MANYWADNPYCQAVWNFDPSTGLLVDSKNGQTITKSTGASQESSNYRQGDGSIYLNRGATPPGYLYLPDASMGANMPLKYGTSNFTFTFMLWFYMNALPPAGNSFRLFSKHDGAWPSAGMGIYLTRYLDEVFLRMYLSQSAIQFEDNQHSFTTISITEGKWYHLTMRLNGSSHDCRSRLYDLTEDTVENNITLLNYQFLPALCTDPFVVGGIIYDAAPGYSADAAFNGYLDEVVVFNSWLGDEEVDQVIDGEFGVMPLIITPDPARGIGSTGTDFEIVQSLPAHWRSGWFGQEMPRNYKMFRHGKLVKNGSGFQVQHVLVDHKNYTFRNPLTKSLETVSSSRLKVNEKARLHQYLINFPKADDDAELLQLVDHYFIRSER